MFADCLGSFERKEHAIRRFFLVWSMGRDSLSVWTVSPTDESRYRECVRSWRACTPVLTATWQTSLSGVQKRRILRCLAFRNFSLAQTGSRIVKTVTREWLFHLDGEVMAGIAVNLRSRESPEVAVSFITSDWYRSVPCTWLRLRRSLSSLTTETMRTTGHGLPWVRARQIWRTDPSDTTGGMQKYHVREDAQK